MRPIRRNDHTPRVEMTPMIDVVFLLLTFFIYSVVMMVRAQVLPVTLSPVLAGTTGEGGNIHAITIDSGGKYFFDQEPMTAQQLDARLAELAADPSKPSLYLAVQEAGTVDRGPLFVDLVGRVNAAGITRFSIVGPPREPSPKSESSDEQP